MTDELSTKKGTVLVIDDDPGSLGLLFDHLREADYKVLLAEDGHSGTEILERFPPDIVLMDVRLPDTSGFELCKAFMSTRREPVPFIFITGLTDIHDKLTGLDLKAVDYITKPFHPEEVVARIENHLAVSRLRRQLMDQNRCLESEVARRAALEHELIEARDAAEIASRAKSDFLTRMSHEIRTPVNAILGMLELTLRSELTPQTRESLTMAMEATNHLLGVVNDCLDLSKIEAGRMVLEDIDFDPRQSLNGIIQTMRSRAGEKGLDFRSSIAPEVPMVLRGDPLRLRQVFYNLLDNAVKFTQDGFIQLLVDLDADDSPDEEPLLRVRVQDTGIGIPADRLERVFESFQQADTSTIRRFGGTGLGLAICRQLTRLMGGDIQVISMPGQGSTFTCTMRLRRGDSDHVAPWPLTPAPVQPTKARQGHILVVEDSPPNRIVAVRFLETLGQRDVVAVDNGEQALELLAAEPFDLVFMDVEMPGLDGIECTRRVREGKGPNAEVVIIALTAHVLEQARRSCLEAGMNDFLAKPLILAEMGALITRHLGGRAKTPQPRTPAKPREGKRSLLLDMNTALELMGGDQEIYNELAGMFAVELPQRLEILHHLLDAEELEQTRAEGHRFKGYFRTLGANSCAELAVRLEEAAAAHDLRASQSIFEELHTEANLLLDLLRHDARITEGK